MTVNSRTRNRDVRVADRLDFVHGVAGRQRERIRRAPQLVHEGEGGGARAPRRKRGAPNHVHENCGDSRASAVRVKVEHGRARQRTDGEALVLLRARLPPAAPVDGVPTRGVAPQPGVDQVSWKDVARKGEGRREHKAARGGARVGHRRAEGRALARQRLVGAALTERGRGKVKGWENNHEEGGGSMRAWPRRWWPPRSPDDERRRGARSQRRRRRTKPQP